MRIMSPPKFIMNISLIMRLIIALIVFQCGVDAAGPYEYWCRECPAGSGNYRWERREPGTGNNRTGADDFGPYELMCVEEPPGSGDYVMRKRAPGGGLRAGGDQGPQGQWGNPGNPDDMANGVRRGDLNDLPPGWGYIVVNNRWHPVNLNVGPAAAAGPAPANNLHLLQRLGIGFNLCDGVPKPADVLGYTWVCMWNPQLNVKQWKLQRIGMVAGGAAGGGGAGGGVGRRLAMGGLLSTGLTTAVLAYMRSLGTGGVAGLLKNVETIRTWLAGGIDPVARDAVREELRKRLLTAEAQGQGRAYLDTFLAWTPGMRSQDQFEAAVSQEYQRRLAARNAAVDAAVEDWVKSIFDAVAGLGDAVRNAAVALRDALAAPFVWFDQQLADLLDALTGGGEGSDVAVFLLLLTVVLIVLFKARHRIQGGARALWDKLFG